MMPFMVLFPSAFGILAGYFRPFELISLIKPHKGVIVSANRQAQSEWWMVSRRKTKPALIPPRSY